MENTFINLSQIVTLEIYPKKANTLYRYVRPLKLFRLALRKAHFSYAKCVRVPLNDVGDKNCYVENNTVFLYPHIQINMSDNTTRYKYFKTEESMQEYAFNLFNKQNFLKL